MTVLYLQSRYYTYVSEAEIVKQTCKYIRDKKTLIPKEKLEEIGIITYLNILE